MINIAQRLRPFSHRPGSRCLIPGTPYIVEAYPTRILIRDLADQIIKETLIEIEGPLKQFTLMQDLERGCVTVWSENYRLHVLPNLEISYNKHPPFSSPLHEKLALGSHKKQEWERIRERIDFTEIFPLWFRLGLFFTLPPRSGDNRGPFALLDQCQKAIAAHRPEQIIPLFEKLFLAGFGHILIPRATDDDFQGILPDGEPSIDSPLHLLTEGVQLIRSLFVVQEGHEIAILPNLPPELFAGRLIGVDLPPYGTLNLEWSKKMIRQLHFKPSSEGEVIFKFSGSIGSFRLRYHHQERGVRRNNGETLAIKSGSHYLLDQFQK